MGTTLIDSFRTRRRTGAGKRDERQDLLVPVAISPLHVAMSVLRMEPA